MNEDGWQDKIVGARMTVDQEFADRVAGSSFSRQQWSLVMTAVEFDIRDPDDPETARLVANTEQLPAILPELDSIEEQMQTMGGGAGGSSGPGIIERVKTTLGLGGEEEVISEDRRVEAETLTQEYADELQAHLESKGRWEEVRIEAADSQDFG